MTAEQRQHDRTSRANSRHKITAEHAGINRLDSITTTARQLAERAKTAKRAELVTLAQQLERLAPRGAVLEHRVTLTAQLAKLASTANSRHQLAEYAQTTAQLAERCATSTREYFAGRA